jgi:prefoldin beta subunit
MADQQQHLQALSEEYQKLEQGQYANLSCHVQIDLILYAELQSSIQSRQRLESQQQENRAVQKVRRDYK